MPAPMTAAQLASSFVSRALEESKLSGADVWRMTGVSEKQISALKCARTKLGGRLDTLVAILAACGYELRMEKKNVETKTQHRTNDGTVCEDSKDRNDFLAARRNK